MVRVGAFGLHGDDRAALIAFAIHVDGAGTALRVSPAHMRASQTANVFAFMN